MNLPLTSKTNDMKMTLLILLSFLINLATAQKMINIKIKLIDAPDSTTIATCHAGVHWEDSFLYDDTLVLNNELWTEIEDGIILLTLMEGTCTKMYYITPVHVSDLYIFTGKNNSGDDYYMEVNMNTLHSSLLIYDEKKNDYNYYKQ